MESVHFVRFILSVYPFSRQLSRFPHLFYVDQFLLRIELRLILKVLMVTSRLGKKEKECICFQRRIVEIIVFTRVG